MRDFGWHRESELDKHHKKTPKKPIGGFVQSDQVENFVQPTGYLQSSGVRDVYLDVELGPGTPPGRLTAIVVTYNILTVNALLCKIAWLSNN